MRYIQKAICGAKTFSDTPIYSQLQNIIFATVEDQYWSSDSTVLLPFNYHPSRGAEVSRVYFAREGTRAFVRAARSLGTAKPDSGG
jgi:hypothetical protein